MVRRDFGKISDSTPFLESFLQRWQRTVWQGCSKWAGDATLLYYTTDEAKEGRDAFKESANLTLEVPAFSVNTRTFVF